MTPLCGRICMNSTRDPGAVLSTWLSEVSRARTSVQPAEERASRKETEADCGSSLSVSFAIWNPDTSSWRTSQRSLFEDSTPFSEAWPNSGMMRNGKCSRRARLAPATAATASGSLPDGGTWQTATTTDAGGRDYTYPAGDHDKPFLTLTGQAQSSLWQTPTVADQDVYGATADNRKRANGKHLADQVMWQTPQLPNGGGKCRGQGRGDELLLEGQSQQVAASLWSTPDANVFADGFQCAPEEWEARRQRLKETANNGNGCGTPLPTQAAEQLWMTPCAHPEAPNLGSNKTGPASILGQANPLSSLHLPATSPPGAPSSPNDQTLPPPCVDLPQLLARCKTWSSGNLPAAKKKSRSTKKPAGAKQKKTVATPTTGEGITLDESTLYALTSHWLKLRDRYWKPRLNQNFVSWLMGFPQGWVSPEPMPCAHSGMQRFLARQQRHLSCLVGASAPASTNNIAPPNGRRRRRETPRTADARKRT